MRFLIDAQLPPALARWLGERGYPATAVRDAGLRDSDDGSIRFFLVKGNWVLITKDDDFVERTLNETSGPSIVWLRIGNCTNRVLFAWLEPLWPDIVKQLNAGQRIVEVRHDKKARRGRR